MKVLWLGWLRRVLLPSPLLLICLEEALIRCRLVFPCVCAAQLMDELRYRLIGLDSYRQSVQARVDASLERFQQRSQRASKDLQKDVDQQLAKALALHEWYMDHLNKQQQRLADLTRTEIVQRQRTLNQSLEQFKKSYDDTLSSLRPPALIGKTFLTKVPPPLSHALAMCFTSGLMVQIHRVCLECLSLVLLSPLFLSPNPPPTHVCPRRS